MRSGRKSGLPSAGKAESGNGNVHNKETYKHWQRQFSLLLVNEASFMLDRSQGFLRVKAAEFPLKYYAIDAISFIDFQENRFKL